MQEVLALITSVVFTILVVGFIFFLAWFVPRILARHAGGAAGVGQGRNIRVLERVAVTKDSALLLVEAFGRRMLVGVTPQGMSVLRDEDAAAVILEEPPAPPGSFREAFRQTLDASLPNGRVKDFVHRVIPAKGGEEDEQ